VGTGRLDPQVVSNQTGRLEASYDDGVLSFVMTIYSISRFVSYLAFGLTWSLQSDNHYKLLLREENIYCWEMTGRSVDMRKSAIVLSVKATRDAPLHDLITSVFQGTKLRHGVSDHCLSLPIMSLSGCTFDKYGSSYVVVRLHY
jgi:hypothetical protein